MRIIDSLKPNYDEIKGVAEEEASIDGSRKYSPLSFGPVINSILIGFLIISSIPWLLYRVCRSFIGTFFISND